VRNNKDVFPTLKEAVLECARRCRALIDEVDGHINKVTAMLAADLTNG
jgi:hypothetical protein